MIDIVIVNHNSTDFLIQCLGSIKSSLNRFPADIHVLDNASTDGVGRVLVDHPDIHLTRHRVNLGFARAANRGIRLGSGQFIVLLNPDTQIVTGFFDRSMALMENHPEIGIMGPKILEPDGSLQHSARSFPTFLTAFFGRSSPLSRWFPDHPMTRKNLLSASSNGVSPMEVDWVSGACMVIRRKAAEEVGLLDERFFMYWEDADYCKSMWECGWKVVYDPRPTVYHYAGASSSQAVFRSVCEFHKSVYRWYDKHGPWTTVALRPLLLAGLILRGTAVLAGRLYPRFKKNPGDDREGFLWNRSPEKRGETVFLSQIVIF